MNTCKPREYFTAAVLDGKIVVAGGVDGRDQVLSPAGFIDIDNLLEYAPLHYPLPSLVFGRILEVGKAMTIDAIQVMQMMQMKLRTKRLRPSNQIVEPDFSALLIYTSGSFGGVYYSIFTSALLLFYEDVQVHFKSNLCLHL